MRRTPSRATWRAVLLSGAALDPVTAALDVATAGLPAASTRLAVAASQALTNRSGWPTRCRALRFWAAVESDFLSWVIAHYDKRAARAERCGDPDRAPRTLGLCPP